MTPHGPRSSRQWPPRVRSRKRSAPSVSKPSATSRPSAPPGPLTEERAKRYALDGQLTAALAAQPLVTGGAEQLTQLWRSQFIVEPQGDTFNVRTQDFQPVGSWIAAQLGRPEYAHFLRAANPGGGTAGALGVQSAPTAPGAANAATAEAPRNMGDAIARQMAGIAKTQAQNPHLSGGSSLTDAGVRVPEAAAGFGLRRSG